MGPMDSWEILKREGNLGLYPERGYKLVLIKDAKSKRQVQDLPRGEYKVKVGYLWLIQQAIKPPWAKIVWSRISLPMHSFTAWLFTHNKLPVLQRIGRFLQLPTLECTICRQAKEKHHYLFFECQFAQQIWTQFQ